MRRWVGAHASGHDQGNQADSDIHAAVLGYLRGGETTAQRATATSREMKDKRNRAKEEKLRNDAENKSGGGGFKQLSIGPPIRWAKIKRGLRRSPLFI